MFQIPLDRDVIPDRANPIQSAVSNLVEDALRSLARKHNTTRFVKLHQLDAEMDDIAVPGVLAYKGGDCFANLVSIMNELPAGREWSTSALESILQQYVSCFISPSAWMRRLDRLPTPKLDRKR